MPAGGAPATAEDAAFAAPAAVAALPASPDAPASDGVSASSSSSSSNTRGAPPGSAAPKPDEPVVAPAPNDAVAPNEVPVAGDSNAPRLASPPTAGARGSLQQPLPQLTTKPHHQPEESPIHFYLSPDSEGPLFPPGTTGHEVSGHSARQTPPPPPPLQPPVPTGHGDDHVHDNHLAHGTHPHSERSSKAEVTLSSYNSNPTPSKHRRQRQPPVNPLLVFSKENIKVTAVSIIGGLVSGYTIALVPVYSQLFVSGTNCALYTAPLGCEAVPFADCMWHTTTATLSNGTTQTRGYCGWPTITCREAYPNDGWMGGGGNTTLAELNCLQDSRCTWSYSAKECQNPSGYSQKELAVFSGSMIAGNMVGAILGGPLVTSMGTRLTFLVSGYFCTITCIMGHADSYVNDFWVLAVSRFVLGIFVGLITVACPLYVHENAIPKYKAKTGTMFQVFGTAGSFFAAVIGLGEGDTIHYDANADQHISARMQGITAGQTLLSILLFLLGIFSTESKVKFRKGESGALNQNEYSFWKMMPRLLMAVALNATFRFTGFNALANFGPKLMSSFKIEPYLGVFIIMTVNFFGGIVSMPASLLASPKVLFLFGSCFISCMCLFLCGIPVYPGVASESVTNNCAVVGICLYIFTYEVFVGPSFYVLCQEIFPPSFRPRGNSFAQLWQFIFNLVINACYSIAVVSFSGGPEGNQHKGQAIIFIFFGGLGLVLFVYEFLCLDLWDEAAEAERKRKAAEEAGAAAVTTKVFWVTEMPNQTT
jgi:hypothetical protein